MMVMKTTKYGRLLTVAVLFLILGGNCGVFSQRNGNNGSNSGGLQKQQQQQMQVTNATATIANTTTTTANATNATNATTNSKTKATKNAEPSSAARASTFSEVGAINKTKHDDVAEKQATPTTPLSIESATTNSRGPMGDAAVAATPATSRSSSEIFGNGDSIGESAETAGDSAEILANSEEEVVVPNLSILPTTYRPIRPSISPHTSAQERERRLMNVLAARRTALHRGGYTSRVGTTGRTSIETTSKSPTDPRSICIRNCTKNFTRRTTASCMRQCANFARLPIANSTMTPPVTGTVVVRPSSKSGQNTQTGERYTNEILFTDESSHGLFVVAKEQNDTMNHISDGLKNASGAKFRARGKPMQVVTVPATSVEDDDIQPYLYFGQKLPPLKPAMLTITSVSDEHPKLLEVSVSELATTTPAPPSSKITTLSAVERSRSRYKYNMRDRSTSGFIRLNNAGLIRPAATLQNSSEPRVGSVESEGFGVSSTTRPIKANTALADTERTNDAIKAATPPEDSNSSTKMTPIVDQTTPSASSSTPLIITVLSDEEEEVVAPVRNAGLDAIVTTTTPPASTSSPILTAAPITSSNTNVTFTTMATPTNPTATSSTSPSTVRPPTGTPTTTSPPSLATSSSITSTTTSKTLSLIESENENLRALAPMLIQEPVTEDRTNLVVFLNRTMMQRDENGEKSSQATTARSRTLSQASTTDASSTILRTTVLTSVRSTVHPPGNTSAASSATQAPPAANNKSGNVSDGYLNADAIGQEAVGNDIISSTAVANDRDVSIEMRRINLATIVLAGIGIVPLAAVILYVLRTLMARHNAKDDEDFDVCITDQQPISPVKKLDSKHHPNKSLDDVDHPHQQQNKTKGHTRDSNHNNHNYDEQCSVTSDQEFDRGNLRLKSLLGEGNFGQVWKAEADDLSGHFGATRIVAVKTIRQGTAQLSLKDEANIMRKLGSHPNVVTLLGACVESEPHMIIMEYAMRGRLLSLLRAARNATSILPASVPGGRSLAPLSPRTLAGFALDIACGMEYIAERKIVHRDLAARNVLLDHNGMCKICDFGMSLDLDEERQRREDEKNIINELSRNGNKSKKTKFDFGGRFIMSHWSNSFGQQATSEKESVEKKGNGCGQHDTIKGKPALPIRWMAPEALQYHIFSTETDVWAFGILLWEIATLGSTPYCHLSGREIVRRVPLGLRPELPKDDRHEFYNLMSHCWRKEPYLRPTFTQARLEILRSLHKWVDDDSAASDYMDVSGFSEDLEHGVVYFNHRISEFECEI